jgi:hypothetical protein
MPLFTSAKVQTKARRQPYQYRATMMIATTRNTAISDSARSSFFDRRVAGTASIGGITQTPCSRLLLLPGPAAFGENQPVTVRDATKQAGQFERIGAFCAGRHFARILKGVRGHGVLSAAGRRGFLFYGHSSYQDLLKLVCAIFRRSSESASS